MISDVPYRTIDRESPAYPPSLSRLGPDAPERIGVRGSLDLLTVPLTALFSSVHVPGEAALAAFDIVRRLDHRSHPVIGGFHSPLERECLDLLLQGTGSVVVSPARSIECMGVPIRYRQAFAKGRLLMVSAFSSGRRRPSQAMARSRNRFVTALAARIVVIHASPGGRLQSQMAEALRWGIPISCVDIPENRDLLVMGARPLGDAASVVGQVDLHAASTR